MGRGVAKILTLQPRQAVDLQRVDERAETEGGAERQPQAARAPDGKADAEENHQGHVHGHQIAPLEIVRPECGKKQRRQEAAHAGPEAE